MNARHPTRILLALCLAAGLSGHALAASQHSHEGATGHALEMKLNNGRKWQTDAPLRQGMSEIRAVVSASLERIHKGRFTPADYATLGDRIQAQIDYVTANCKLSEDADLQLHVSLTQIIEGAAAMKEKTGQEQGAVRVVRALDAYGKYFDHPGWKPLGH